MRLELKQLHQSSLMEAWKRCLCRWQQSVSVNVATCRELRNIQLPTREHRCRRQNSTWRFPIARRLCDCLLLVMVMTPWWTTCVRKCCFSCGTNWQYCDSEQCDSIVNGNSSCTFVVSVQYIISNICTGSKEMSAMYLIKMIKICSLPTLLYGYEV